jgi:hypothetical protein
VAFECRNSNSFYKSHLVSYSQSSLSKEKERESKERLKKEEALTKEGPLKIAIIFKV